ncbi:MAG: carboxypeptidase-like regulatory domain-containing protein [Candidatus Rifleibacteriota bacterium]
MNLRFWGGWFLFLAGIAVMLTMGCEKGGLGVKSALVKGKVVDRSNSAPISGATVRMISMEEIGTSELKQGNNYAYTRTNQDGDFVFENVRPDNVIFEFQANGFAEKQYPQTSGGGEADEETGETLTSQVDKVYVRSGSVTDIGAVGLIKVSNPLPESITAKITLRDSKTREVLDNTRVGNFEVSFNNDTYTTTVNDLMAGKDINGNDIELEAGSVIEAKVQADSSLYLVKEESFTGSGDIVADMFLEPVTYNLLMRCVNVPDYINGGVVNIFAEIQDGNKPPQIIATQTIDDLGNLSGPNLPALVKVPGLALPVDLRIQVRGYEDEIVTVSSLPEGSQGSYRIDIDFLYDNGTEEFSFSEGDSASGRAGLYDNIIARDVILRVAGPDIGTGDSLTGAISLPFDTANSTTSQVYNINNQSTWDLTFSDVAVGYSLYYTVSVSPVSSATGTYNISSEDGIMINPPVASPASTLLIGVEAKRPE